MAQVFLSYDREDLDRAQGVASALEKAGHHVWWDRHIKGGAQYNREIEQALSNADSVVVLWSRRSVDSAWVRDEAAAGRDSGRLIPARLDTVDPPLGFRQYQTIDLSGWRGRTKGPVKPLLDAVASLSESPVPGPSLQTPVSPSRTRPRLLLPLLILVGLVVVASAGWRFLVQSSGPATVAVEAADASPSSREMARSLLVKLGTLQGSSATSVRLLDQSGDARKADLRISIGGSRSGQSARATVALVSNKDRSMLWSKEFVQTQGSQADLEEALAFAAARVLGCATEEASHEHGRLRPELKRTFLNACASMAELGWDTRSVIPMLRAVVKGAPKFRPAWALLVRAESDSLTLTRETERPAEGAPLILARDIAQARRVDPNMAEATLAEIVLMPKYSIAKAIALVDKAKSQEPENPNVLIDRSGLMQSVGRMSDGIDDSARAAELDPLSPNTRTSYISTLAYGGRIDAARAELARAKQLWPGTQTIRQAEYSLELRFGDFEKAMRSPDSDFGPGAPLYIQARRSPTDANVKTLLDFVVRGFGSDSLNFATRASFLVQAMGELNRPDEFYALLPRLPIERNLKDSAYILFRPSVASLRRDPRFMRLAKNVGLVEYWRQSGAWPDYCREPDLPYDCKAEAAKLG